MTNRIQRKFETLDRKALINFVMAGDPDIDTTRSVLLRLVKEGADIIEIGMPFTDPAADGPTIQLAGQRALKSGTTLADILSLVKAFRAENTDTPIVLMGYYNPVFAYGVECFMKDASDAGADGLIIVDLPPEEANEILPHAKKHGLDIIRLITPTTDEKRLETVLEGASGFLYYVSITGVTGAASADISKLKPHLETIRKHTDLPIAIGFGIKTPDDVREMAAHADAVVVGSAIVQTLFDHREKDAVGAVGETVKALAGALR